MSGGETSNKARKAAYFIKLVELLDTYHKVLIVTADNVGSFQMQKIRQILRGRAVILMGKNTMIRRCIRSHLEKNPSLEGLLPFVWGNVGLIFTNLDPGEIRAELAKNRVQAPAKAGAVSPVDVIVPAGGTGQEPTKTSFFQALSIPTKIMKGAIEIINDVHLIKVGEKVSPSQAVLLQMLNIKPFQYGLNVIAVFDGGVVYEAKLLDLTDQDILNKFCQGVANVASLSLQIGHPTVASLPHSVINAYKNLVSICLETDYSFQGAEKIKEMLANPEAFAAAVASTTTTTTSSAPASKGGDDDDDGKKKKGGDDDDDVGGMGDLFGGDEEGGMGGLFGGDD